MGTCLALVMHAQLTILNLFRFPYSTITGAFMDIRYGDCKAMAVASDARSTKALALHVSVHPILPLRILASRREASHSPAVD